MQQRQLRLGDILDDYCPRERRLTNHAVVAMVGDEVKQTRCTTCDADHEYKHAKVPRQRRKDTVAGLQAQVLASGPKRAPEPLTARAPDTPELNGEDEGADRVIEHSEHSEHSATDVHPPTPPQPLTDGDRDADNDNDADEPVPGETDGPAHRRLIRAQLPRTEGQPPPSRPAPDFTIRHPGGGRPNRFRPRQQRGAGPSFPSNRSGQSSGGQARGGAPRNGGNSRAPMAPRPARRPDNGRKRSR